MTAAIEQIELDDAQATGAWDTDALAFALRQRFPTPEWAFFREVRNTTGVARVARSADALAMNLWPSRGLELHGFEIKAFRSDWLREMRAPAKAEEISRYCDRWWLVAAPKVVHPGELPPTWGLLEPRGKHLVVKTEAPRLQAQSLDRGFVAAILRVACESTASKAEIDAAVKAERERAEAKQEEAIERDRRLRSDSYRDLRAQVDAFEKTSGVRIESYGGAEIGEAVALVRKHGLTGWGGIRRHLSGLQKNVKDLCELLEKALADEGGEVDL